MIARFSENATPTPRRFQATIPEMLHEPARSPDVPPVHGGASHSAGLVQPTVAFDSPVLGPSQPPRALALCALEHEARLFRKYAKIPLVVTGLGAAGIAKAFAQRAQWPYPKPTCVILVGTSGALDPALARGTAYAANEVRTLDGRSWLPTRTVRSGTQTDQAHQPTVLSIDQPALVPASKRTLWNSTHAGLVDMESAAFAEACEREHLNWAVVRGVSDAANDALPRECVEFVDANGRTRIGAVLRAILRRPTLLRELLRLQRATEDAMRSASFDADSFSCLEAPAFASADRPLLLYGGSFDPPHARHATMLADAMRALRSPCAVVMPAAINPLKASTPPAPADARHAMCVSAFAENEADFPSEVRVSSFELSREGPSYTIDTLAELFRRHAHLRGATRLLIGSDAIRSIERWRAWKEVLAAAPPAIVVRPPDDHASVRAFLREFGAKHGFADAESWLLPLEPVDLSSTDARAAMARGERPAGLSDGVWREITARGLYGVGSDR